MLSMHTLSLFFKLKAKIRGGKPYKKGKMYKNMLYEISMSRQLFIGNRNSLSFEYQLTNINIKGCICYIFACLFCMSKREHL